MRILLGVRKARRAEPFISKLSTECQLNHDEVEAFKSLVPDFREIVGAYLDMTLKRNPDYLRREVKAFEELLNGLCLTLYIARLCSNAHHKQLNPASPCSGPHYRLFWIREVFAMRRYSVSQENSPKQPDRKP